jgi:tetratricopeptide (TPR) repeat protein
MDPKKVLASLCIPAIVPIGALAYQQSRIWENNLVFWEHTVEHNPYNILARNALGLEYHERQRYNEAKYQFEFVLALQQIPMSLKLKALNNLANIYTDTKYPGYSLEQAANLYEMGIKNAERKNLTYELRINLAQADAQMGKMSEATQIIKEVYSELKSDPDSRNIWLIPFIEKMVGGKPLSNAPAKK